MANSSSKYFRSLDTIKAFYQQQPTCRPIVTSLIDFLGLPLHLDLLSTSAVSLETLVLVALSSSGVYTWPHETARLPPVATCVPRVHSTQGHTKNNHLETSALVAVDCWLFPLCLSFPAPPSFTTFKFLYNSHSAVYSSVASSVYVCVGLLEVACLK